MPLSPEEKERLMQKVVENLGRKPPKKRGNQSWKDEVAEYEKSKVTVKTNSAKTPTKMPPGWSTTGRQPGRVRR